MFDKIVRKLCIAYGSNINSEQVLKRTPSAIKYKVGYIRDYQLIFKGVATIEPRKKYKVPVLTWWIDTEAEAGLDVYEGVKNNLYRKENISVFLEDSNGVFEKVEGMVYILNRDGASYTPGMKYYLTIMEGYLENNLPLRFLSSAYEKAYKIQKFNGPKVLNDKRVVIRNNLSYTNSAAKR